MKDYYQILGVDELTSKPLMRIAYVTAIDYAITNQLEGQKIKDINEAFQVLKSYRRRMRYNDAKRKGKPDQKMQKILEEINSDPNSTTTKIFSTSSRVSLEIRYILKSLFLEIYIFLIYIISSTLGDFLDIMSSGFSWFSSMIFYFGIINFWTNWLPHIYSVIAIIASIGILIWFLKNLEKGVIKAVSTNSARQ